MLEIITTRNGCCQFLQHTRGDQSGVVPVVFFEATQALANGDLPGAAGKFKQSTALDGRFCAGYFDLGNVYEHQGKTAEALSAFEDSLKCLKSDSPHSVRGSEAIREGEIDRTTRRIENLKPTSDLR